MNNFISSACSIDGYPAECGRNNCLVLPINQRRSNMRTAYVNTHGNICTTHDYGVLAMILSTDKFPVVSFPFHSASICSNDLPFVSGNNLYTVTKAIAQNEANTQKVPAAPIFFSMIGVR